MSKSYFLRFCIFAPYNRSINHKNSSQVFCQVLKILSFAVNLVLLIKLILVNVQELWKIESIIDV